jgi:hypothetical protein
MDDKEISDYMNSVSNRIKNKVARIADKYEKRER